MTRPYAMKRRAEQQEETRLRIVEAAIAWHSSVGPAAATLSMIAERAGVQRHTLYAHFPDERSLAMACSGLSLSRDPLPDASPWRAIRDPAEKLRTGLGAVYSWYTRNANLAACVLRDVEHHQLTQEIVALRMTPTMTAWADILGMGLKAKQRAMLSVALNFPTWRTLVRDGGMKTEAAVALMADAVLGSG